MTALTEVFVTVKPDTDKFGPEVKKKLARIDASKSGKDVAARWGVGFNGAFGGIVSKSAGLFAGAFAAVQGVKIFGGFINDARESEKISRITANAIKATGGAAKISADQVGALATSISNKTAIDDEQVQSAANMLLTFKNIRNETGKGNDVFNQATQAAADLSVQFGGIDGASKQLGKALNDPIKGTTALAKAGVTFTEQQKKQIKTLVESGNVLGAQKIILAEIEGQVGGAAAAAADPVEKLKVVAGNLAEEVGGFLLPTVNKFASFATGTLIPGVKGLFALFKDGDFTTEFREAFNVEEDSGFVDFLLRVRETAISVFNEIKGGISAFAAAWKFNDGEVTSSGFPGFMERIGYTARQAFDVFKTEVLPRLKEFAGFLVDKVIPPVATFAATVLASKDFLFPFAGIILGVVGALKAWALVQGVLNVVMSANPIGIVVLAIAGLVAGIIYAYKNSEKFRAILQGAFQGIQKAAQTAAPLIKAAIDVVIGVFQFWWTYVAKPILTGFWEALQFAWGQATKFGQVVVAGFNAIKEPARAAIAFVVRRFLDFVGDILAGAAKAFGWVPELGGKLKSAATEFGKFRDSVNGKLSGITDQSVNVEIKYSSKGVNLTTPSSVGRYADGGGVFGGTRGKDSVPALLMPDEHVWTTREVRAAGGHGAMKRMREAALRGELHGYAAGGAVGFNVRSSYPSASLIAKEVAAHALKAAGPYIKAGAKQIATAAPGGPPGARQSFRGVTLNQRTIRMLLNAERLLGAAFHITQGSYSTRVAASGSTHAGGGAMDTNGPKGWSAAVRALRAAGFAAWHRTPSQGPWNHHIHSIALGDSSASPAAKAQMASFRRGGNGLGGMAKGGKVGSYAEGAWRIVADQLAMVHKDEMIIPKDHADWIRRMVPKVNPAAPDWADKILDTNRDLSPPRPAWARNQTLDQLRKRARQLRASGTDGAGASGGDADIETVRLDDATIAKLADAIAKRPLVMDGRRLDEALTRRALNGGY